MAIKIKVVPENRDKINKIIEEVEGRATVRTCNYSDVERLVETLETRLDIHNIPKKYRPGTEGSYLEHIGVKAYKKIAFKAASTQIYVIRGAKDWFFKGADRIEIDPALSPSDYSFYPTQEAVKIVRNRAEDNFREL